MRTQPSNSNATPAVSLDPTSVKEMSGKIVMVTGASSGIGFETACELARRGAHVILLCRDKTRGQAALESVNRAGENSEAELLLADLESQASIRSAVIQFLQNHSKLDVLVNNAGLLAPKRHVTVDGYEETFAVNYLGHFLLTRLLLPLLKASAPARIINVSSLAHKMGRIHWDDLQLEKKYSRLQAYGQSKLANILFTLELSKRLQMDRITVNCLHPGLVATKFARNELTITKKLLEYFGISPQKGARTSVYLATSKEVEKMTGGYFVKMKLHQPSLRARNEKDASRLWEISEKLAGLTPESTSSEGLTNQELSSKYEEMPLQKAA